MNQRFIPKLNVGNPTLTNQFKKTVSNTGNKIKDATNSISNSAKVAKNTITEGIKKKVENIQQKVKQISDKSEISQPITKWTAMTQEFLYANTAISKFVSFILSLLLFVILFQFGVGILQYFIGPQYNPYIINGMVPSNKQMVVSTNPNIASSVPIYRSVDAPQGIEFSWNVWFIVEDILSKSLNRTPLIFSKGTNSINSLHISDPNPKYINVSPGLFITLNDSSSDGKNGGNSLTLVMDTYIENSTDANYEIITIPNIPMQKWICCTIRVQGTYVDVYINGVLTKRTILINNPKQNYYDTYIGDSGGFNGYISSLRYYASAISYEEIQSLFASGPSLKILSSNIMPLSNDFLSMNWYYKYNTNT